MKKVLISLGFAALALGANAQVKIKDGTVTGSSTTPNSNAILELESNNKGLLYPRVALQATNLSAPLPQHIKGMMVYDTVSAGDAPYTVTPGIYYNDGTQWVRASGKSDWLIFGNANSAVNGTPAGSTDSQYVTGRVAIGTNTAAAVASATSGSNAAQQLATFTVANGDANINTLTVGLGGGQDDSSLVVGYQALYNNSTGIQNIAVGAGSLAANISGSYNTAIGFKASNSNTTGRENTVLGYKAFLNNTTGNWNTAIGQSALRFNTEGNYNTAVGLNALSVLTGANPNGNINTGTNPDGNTNSYNTALGMDAGNTQLAGSNNIVIGYNQQLFSLTGSDQMNIGGSIFGINMNGTIGAPAGNIGINTAVPTATLSVNGTANNPSSSWGTFSDRRIKTDIKPFTDGLNVITRLKPVTFRYTAKSGYSDQQTKHVGFIAQDVEEVAPYMVTKIDDSKGASGLSDKRELNVSALNQILVNAIQEQQKEIEQLKKQVEELLKEKK